MNKLHKQRLIYVVLLTSGLAIASSLILYALKQNINVFITPKQIATLHLSTPYHFRLGGVVKKGSVVRDQQGLGVQFIVTDFKSDVLVQYNGVLPDLFREGKGVITEGHLNTQGTFLATSVLAKHDENYMPKNVYLAMRKNAAPDFSVHTTKINPFALRSAKRVSKGKQRISAHTTKINPFALRSAKRVSKGKQRISAHTTKINPFALRSAKRVSKGKQRK